MEDDLRGLFEASGKPKLDERFSIAISRIRPVDEKWIIAIFHLLIVSIRELKVSELKAAVETVVNAKRWNFKQFLEVQCGLFVQILIRAKERSEPTVQLIHDTFATFLIESRRCLHLKFLVLPEIGHAQIVVVCLTIMSSETAETNGFLAYASMYWVDHLNHAIISGAQFLELLQSLCRFFTSNGVAIWVKHGLSKIPNYRGLQVSVEEPSLQDITKWLRSIKTFLRDVDSQLVESLFWREFMNEQTWLGNSIGKAAANVWVSDHLPEFNHTATCFSLAAKYFSRMNSVVLDISDWTGEFVDPEHVATWTDPSHRTKSQNMAVAYFLLHDWPACIRQFSLSEHAEIGGFSISRYLGEAFLAAGAYEKAIQIFWDAIKENPSVSLLWIGLGKVYEAIAEYDGAIEAFMRGRELNPDDLWFLKVFGDVYEAKNDYNGVIRTFETIIERNPSDSWFW